MSVRSSAYIALAYLVRILLGWDAKGSLPTIGVSERSGFKTCLMPFLGKITMSDMMILSVHSALIQLTTRLVAGRCSGMHRECH
jgi:hypothetical protein